MSYRNKSVSLTPTACPELDEHAQGRYQAAVWRVYPGARWVITGDFGRIIAGDRLISLQFILIDPQAELRAWFDASQRLGDGNDWHARNIASE